MNQAVVRARYFRASVIVLVLAAVHYRVSYTPADVDLWGHIRFGRDIKATGTIDPGTDPYSYLTVGSTWMNHEWLAEYLFAQAYDGLGATGLISLKTAIDMILVAVLYRALSVVGLDPIRAGTAMALVSFLLFYHILAVRPQIFTYLFFALTLLVLKRAEAGQGRWLAALPPIFALWVNLHGGFIAGIGVLLVWSGVHLSLRVCGRSTQVGLSATTVLAAVGLSSVALLLNPYGAGLLTFLVRTATIPRPEIVEWRSVSEERYHFLAYLILVSASLVSRQFSRKRPRPGLLLVYGMTVVLPIVAIRHLPLFAAGFVLLAGEDVADAWNRLAGGDGGRSKGAERFLSAVSGILATIFVAASMSNYSCIPIVAGLGGPFPARAVSLLQRCGVSGNMACHFNWGEYVIWHLGPRIKVSMDGRRETIYSDEIYDENNRLRLGRGDWDEILRRPETALPLVPSTSPPDNLLRLRSDWKPVYCDSLCRLYVREGSSLKARIEGNSPANLPADGDGLCFP